MPARRRVQRGRGLNEKAKANARPKNARKGFKGEKHAPLRTGKGLKRANYMGPGTNLVARLRRGDQPVTWIDGVSKVHDSDYFLAQNDAAIRKADRRMVARAKFGQKNKLDFPVNLLLGKSGIQGKMALENLGLPTTAFTSFGGTKPAEEVALVKRERAKAVQQGFGKKKAKSKQFSKRQRASLRRMGREWRK